MNINDYPENWNLVPVKGKAPYRKNWNKPGTWTREAIAQELAKGNATGVGLLFDEELIGIDFDGITAEHYYETFLSGGVPIPHTVGWKSDHSIGQRLFRVPDRYKGKLVNKEFQTGYREQKEKSGVLTWCDDQVDFRIVGVQSVLPPSPHPDGGAYQWINDPSHPIAELPDYLCELILKPEYQKKVSDTPLFNQPSYSHKSDSDWAIEYLAFVQNSNLEWHEWRNVLFALHSAGVSEYEARSWSATCSKHTDKGFSDVWRHIKDDKSSQITVAYLGKIAKSNGWKGKEWTANRTLTKQTTPSSNSSPDTAETRSTKEKPRPEDYFGSIADLVAAVNQIKSDHGFETPEYRLAMIKLSMASKIPKDTILRLYYDAINPNPEGQIINALTIANTPEEEKELWLFPDLMPKSWVTLFYANGGTGKTRLCHELAKAAVRGGTFLHEYQASFPMKVLFIQIDEPSRQFYDLIREDEGLKHENLDILTDWSCRHTDQLREQIIEHGYDLVILDSLMAAQRDSGLEIKDPAFGNMLREFQNIGNRTKCSFIVLHHTNRAGEFTGNNAIKDAVSCVWELRRGDKKLDTVALKSDERVLDIGKIKIRQGAQNELLLRFDEEEGSFIYQGNYKKMMQPDQKATWAEKIMLYFRANPDIEVTASDLTQVRILDGLKEETARKTCRRLKNDRGMLISRMVPAPVSGTKQELYRLARAQKNKKLSHPLAEIQSGEDLQTSDRVGQSMGQSMGQGWDKGGTIRGDDLDRVGQLLPVPPPVPPYESLPFIESSEGGTTLRAHGGSAFLTPELASRFGKKQTAEIDQRNLPSNGYSGLPVGTLVRLTKDLLTDSEVLKMRSKGQELAWGTIWAIAEVSYNPKGWFLILENTSGTRCTVENLNAVEKVEL